MVIPDVIVAWPRNCDYPLWRQFIRENRHNFNEVIIVFTETHEGEDYRKFIRNAMNLDYIHFLDSPILRADEDWRHVAVHNALIHSYNAEWIWFTEQDFYPKIQHFEEWEVATDSDFNVVAVYDQGRIHPCSILIHRDTLNKTHKQFGVVSGVMDHFGKIQRDLEGMGEKVYKLPDYAYSHLAGLSHNMRLLASGEAPNHKPQEFARYMQRSLKATVPIDDRFKRLAHSPTLLQLLSSKAK